ncbi:MAG: YIP1 family protein [Ruminococcus sp.]|nr:YIP1 family protein [Ruminococcus sp.]
MMDLTERQWVRHAVTHPVEGFEDMRWKRSGSMRIALLIVLLLFFAQIAHSRLYGFQFGMPAEKTFSIVPYLVRSVVIFAAWVAGNWAVCTLLDGEGTARNICIYSAYALIPYIAQLLINVLLSHILIQDEKVFMDAVELIGTGWSAILIFSAVRSVHQYSPGKTCFAIVLTAAAMLVMLFLLVLFLSLIQQIWVFLSTIYTEITYRLRV